MAIMTCPWRIHAHAAIGAPYIHGDVSLEAVAVEGASSADLIKSKQTRSEPRKSA